MEHTTAHKELQVQGAGQEAEGGKGGKEEGRGKDEMGRGMTVCVCV